MARPKASDLLENQQSAKSKFDLIVEKLNKDYGSGTIIKVGDNPDRRNIEIIPSGSLSLDKALGIGGYPVGRIVEIYGPESSGKTTLCLHAIKECQKKGQKAVIVDMEHSLDLKYAASLGVNVDELMLSQPNNGEEALNIVKALVQTDQVGVIVVDSVAALVPKTEAEGDIGDSNVGKQARMISQAMRILTPLIEKSKTLVIFTNQIRMKIGVMFGSPETTAGGEALKFFASVRIDIRKQILGNGDEDKIANKVKAKIVKNKVASPYKTCEFNIKYGEGIDRIQEIMDFAVGLDIIKKGGSWYTFEDIKCQGESGILELLHDNDEFKDKIENLVKSKLNGTKEAESQQTTSSIDTNSVNGDESSSGPVS